MGGISHLCQNGGVDLLLKWGVVGWMRARGVGGSSRLTSPCILNLQNNCVHYGEGGDLKSNNIPVYRKIADCQHNTCVLLSPRNQHLLQQAYDKLERGYRVQHCILSSQHPCLVVDIFNMKMVKTVCNYQNIALLYVTFPL